MLPQSMILESQNAMSAADGATIERRIRISQPDERRGRCKGSRAWDPRRDFFQCMQQRKILSTSNVILPQQERTEPSGHRPCRHGVKSSLRESDVPGDLLPAIFGNVTEPCKHMANLVRPPDFCAKHFSNLTESESRGPPPLRINYAVRFGHQQEGCWDNLRSADNSKSRFAAYVEGLVSVIGHADRAGPLRDYCLGLIMPCERKSVEPMAAVTAPDRTAAQHQSLLHFVGQSPWSCCATPVAKGSP